MISKNRNYSKMFNKSLPIVFIIIFSLVVLHSNCLMTKKMMQKKYFEPNCASSNSCFSSLPNEGLQLNITTQCTKVDLSGEYNYSGIVRSGYLPVGTGGSALAFLFYGKWDVTDPAELKSIPTIIWLNGGPGSSSQLGNFMELGPLVLRKNISVGIVQNQFSWVKKYNVLFVDQPVGTGLSYADTTSSRPYVTSMDDVANDFYYALDKLYNTDDGCFSSKNLNIPATGPLFIFGQSYAGKYAPAIGKKIIEEMSNNNGFLKGLKGVAIGDGFTAPFDILSQVGNWAFHLSLLDYQQRMRVETILLRSFKNNVNQNFTNLHDDFDNALDFIVQKAGDVNVYDIKIDGQYEEFLQPYFRDPHIIKLYGLNTGIIYDSGADDVYNNLYDDFMKNEVSRVEYLLSKNVPVLVYNGQDDLIVQSAGTMKWVDKLRYANIEEFKSSLFTAWKINGKIVGSIKSAGLLEFRIVNNAGHLVPMDCPQAALDLASSFVQKYKA